MAVGSFFLCSPDCPKQPRTSFPFYNFFIQPSLVGSLGSKIKNGIWDAGIVLKMQGSSLEMKHLLRFDFVELGRTLAHITKVIYKWYVDSIYFAETVVDSRQKKKQLT